MSDSDRFDSQLRRELHDFEGRYDIATGDISASEVLALWTMLWRLSEKVIADHRQLKAAERKRRRLSR